MYMEKQNDLNNITDKTERLMLWKREIKKL